MQPDDTVHEVDTAEVTPLWFTKNFHNTPAIPGAGVLFCDVVLTSIAGVLGTVLMPMILRSVPSFAI